MDNFKHIENLEEISLQLKAFSNTIDTIQSQFEIQKAGEEIVSSYTTLKNSVDNIRSQLDIIISDIDNI